MLSRTLRMSVPNFHSCRAGVWEKWSLTWIVFCAEAPGLLLLDPRFENAPPPDTRPPAIVRLGMLPRLSGGFAGQPVLKRYVVSWGPAWLNVLSVLRAKPKRNSFSEKGPRILV